MNPRINKKKILNDPIYGFITLPYDIILDVINHPYFQRLRRIKQLGLTEAVYPGALHTRFHHAVGCTHLMGQAIETLRSNGNEITEEEAIGVTLAILLHDIGHGPFSHALEHSIVTGLQHEEISSILMNKLNDHFNGELSLAIEIFNNRYHKKFLHQLVSSQLDMDRLDYLKRDSFYSGVSEGVVSNQRIIKMLNVVDDGLVVQQKGIYSIEKFIVARRLMYWQVYLHKTVLSAEYLLVKILARAKYLAKKGEELFCSPAFRTFLYNDITKVDFEEGNAVEVFSQLDDYDVMGSIKVWGEHSDKVLSLLSSMLTNRELLKIKLQNQPFEDGEIEDQLDIVSKELDITREEAEYFVFQDWIENNAYNPEIDRINILFKDGTVKDITEASDNLNIQALANPVRKYFMCFPKFS